MSLYFSVVVLLAVLLGLTVVRHMLWWLFVVLPAAAYAGWQFVQAGHSVLYLGAAVATLVAMALAGNDLASVNADRAAAGKPPLTRDEIRRWLYGK